ncbi:GMC oxidoreductase [Streptomyces sp. NBC_00059]|uniref:GMC oxidoreductase n=1 Tax=Streptomyces sp. NBC_00059 TaxID=2975635 RepID=UPI00225294C4|nr:GMC oxidoreductase [Streptomyces sp. NBC_00059]MCX5412737.1 GMC oxidoreductase [Streptomyces sp. NBC_00059]
MTRTYPTAVDVAIVGSGPTGAAYARILSELRPDVHIACFEAGPLLTDPPGQHVKNIPDPDARRQAQQRSQGLSTVNGSVGTTGRIVRPGTFLLDDGYQQQGQDGMPAAAMSSNVGGMGAHWTAACPRPGDSERITYLPDLDDLLTHAERLLGVTPDAFDDAPLADLVRRRLANGLDENRPAGRKVAPMPLAVHVGSDGQPAWSGSDVVFGDTVRTNPRFTLWPETLVTDIVTENDQVNAVRIRDLSADGDAEHTVAARYVVVAADALRTPQLLWASGIRPPALGHYLNDQPQILLAARLTGLPATVHSGQPSKPTTIARHGGVSWVPFTDSAPFHGQVMQLDASPVPLPEADGEPEPGSIVGLGWFCAKDIRREDHISFDQQERDQYGMPAMRIHYTLTERDHTVIERARHSIRQAAQALGDVLDEKPILLAPGASLHYQGTVRMGPVDDGTSVCKPTCEVWNVDGLYVAGNGVIPTATACNPTLTSVALAVRGARDIAARAATAQTTDADAYRTVSAH